MLRQLLTIIAICSASLCNGQSPEDVIYTFFQHMHDGDGQSLGELLSDDVVFLSTSYDLEGNSVVQKGDKVSFVMSVDKSEKGDLDEKISNLKVSEEGNLANVWMDYTFYFKGTMSHCGVNNFTMVRQEGKWQIMQITDTRSKKDCSYDTMVTSIDDMLDRWHLAAAQADSTTYFDLMTNTSMFIGTDKSEVWTKREFLAFAAPYFAKGKAWDFSTVSRNIYLKEENSMAWFDEVLDTWMGPCRGSGVVVLKDGQWKVEHYVLSVTVPNDDVQEFLKIYKPEELRQRK